MAEASQDRTERATPRRRQDARKRGEIPRSRDLAAAAVAGGGVLALIAAGGRLGRGAAALMREGLRLDSGVLHDPQGIAVYFGHLVQRGLWLAAPIVFATWFAGLAAPILLGGWNFSPGALQPNFSRLNPLAGIGRMFSGQSLVELLKSMVKVLCIGSLAGFYLWRQRTAMVGLSAEPLEQGIAHGVGLVLGVSGWMAAALLAVALIDAPYQMWSYARRLRMTKQEVRDEMKSSEGRPEVKARVRRLQHEMSNRRMMEKIPTADVVLTNPTHYAVAIRYKSESMRAPVVVAKGAGEIASTIRELARQHGVLQLSAPPLARALYRSVAVDQEIPTALYAAMARVLTYVYQLRAGRYVQAPVAEDVAGGEPDPD